MPASSRILETMRSDRPHSRSSFQPRPLYFPRDGIVRALRWIISTRRPSGIYVAECRKNRAVGHGGAIRKSQRPPGSTIRSGSSLASRSTPLQTSHQPASSKERQCR